MPLYKCDICNLQTTIKTHFNKHLKTRKHLNNINNLDNKLIKIIPNEEMNTNEHKMNTNEHKMNTNEHKMNTNELMCKFCNKLFNTIPSKRRHEIHYCKLKETTLNFKEIENKYKKEIEKLHQKIEILLEQKPTTTNIFNIDKQINLNSYGKEDLSHITSGFKDHLLKVPFVAIPKMIQEVHFSNKNPENKNIMLPNKKDKFVKVYEDDKWIFKDKKSTITNLVDNKYNIIDDHYEENVNKDENLIAPHVEKQYENFRDLYNDGDKDLHSELRVDCELVLLNNRK
jgi:hypothetical protein